MLEFQKSAIGQRHGIGGGIFGEIVFNGAVDRAQHAVDHPRPLSFPQSCGEFNGFVDGGMRRNRGKQHQLIRAKLQQRPQFRLDTMAGPTDARLDDRIERCLPSHDTIHHFAGETAILRREFRRSAKSVERRSHKCFGLAIFVQDGQRNAPRVGRFGRLLTAAISLISAAWPIHASPSHSVCRSSKNRGYVFAVHSGSAI